MYIYYTLTFSNVENVNAICLEVICINKNKAFWRHVRLSIENECNNLGQTDIIEFEKEMNKNIHLKYLRLMVKYEDNLIVM